MIAISTQLLNSDIIKKLPDNYGINKTGGVIRMDQFLSFITVKLKQMVLVATWGGRTVKTTQVR